MARIANQHASAPAQHCAAGMFSFHKNGIQRHAVPVCLSLSLCGLIIIIELLGVISLVAVLLSLVLLLMWMDEPLRLRMEG
ncbi:MAG: hypothetical protein EOM66_03680 [Clostridia bacterium]|nr:hypothetical protein [Candidatus Pelethousia sp.]NCB30486.1 hypothetical protein [Clostridia bacterium]